ncbi:UNVERIFIED_CONTAM: hypothetical protein K2H54_006119 [Gekko kuhli]
MAKETLQAACLLQILFFSPLFLAAEGQQTGVSSGLRCLNNYGSPRRRVNCTWHRNPALGEGAFYLRFSDTDSTSELSDLVCRLLPSKERRGEFSCSAEGPGEFGENDEYRVSLHDSSSSSSRERVLQAAWEETYDPKQNIKCDPPHGLWSNMSGSKCLIAWKMPVAYVDIWEDMQWQLQFRGPPVPWERAENKTMVARETWMEIDGSEFVPGTSYVARVRCKTPESKKYVSQWSEWSSETEWSVPPGARRREESLVLLAILVSAPLCLGALLLLLLLAGFYPRIRSRCLASTPSPAAFFLPLYAAHNGDFQAWIGLREQGAWLRGGNSSTDPGKGAGPGPATARPLEAVSPLSSLRRLSEGELPPAEERACHLLGTPGQQDKASNYAVMQEEGWALIPPLRRAPLHHPEGLDAAGEGFPYLPYKNSLFVEQGPPGPETPSSCSPASGSRGGGPRSTRSEAPL